MPRDSKAITDLCEGFNPLTEEQQAKARLVVCANAIDVDDAIKLLMILGLHPDQEDEASSLVPVPSLNSLQRGRPR